ncbi:MAG: hypothetical protein IM584_03225 [Chitinophagaceae bacterium]|nr:hypothetical protein [Chitinophagaceae bacterium]MCA6453328.1 hypothetical protein [Chitinophagaceae bacterium]MCA6455127.1 hypothetical protein [Chitinophagaceae bacterium]MCA6459933.1 hypothetical protein [Chitinophagaceae bacterium]MCA6465792.1 hypothetical protein [Chitinophagaceae bacterium]
MKLLIITALKEYSDQAAALLKKAEIHVFSATDISGFKDGSSHNLLDDWFTAGEARFDSVLVFSLTTEEKATAALKLIEEYNHSLAEDFPLRAFIVPVDNFSK